MKQFYNIRMLCKAVNLHHSVYYYHKQNKENSYKKANEILDKKILEEFEKSKKRYGSPKITNILNKQGIKVSQKRVARRMKVLEIRSIIVKKFNHNGNKKVDNTNKENLLAQNFKAEKPGEKWVGDITYIYTKETGWTYGLNMTAELVISAFNKAKTIREITQGMIFHSDLGSQYTSNEFEKLLVGNNVKHSYSKKGYPYDNASMESFNAILKKEEVNVNTYETFNEAKLAIFEFIESWYNNNRIHSSIDYKTPNEKYKEYMENVA